MVDKRRIRYNAKPTNGMKDTGPEQARDLSANNSESGSLYDKVSLLELGLVYNTQTALSRKGITTFKELMKYDLAQMSDWKKFGREAALDAYRKTQAAIMYVQRQRMIRTNSPNYGNLFGTDAAYTANILELISTRPVNEQILGHFPLFNWNSNLADDVRLHSSYRGNSSVKELDLPGLLDKSLENLGIATLRDLLLCPSRDIARKERCGYIAVEFIIDKLTERLLKPAKKDSLISIIEELPIAKNSLKIFLEYLCSEESGKFLNYKEVGEKHDVSKQWVHQVVERFSTALKLKHRHDGVLELTLEPVAEALNRYKGAIRIGQFVEENRETLGLGEIGLKRYLRFAEIVTKQIDISCDLDLFWESHSRCLKCRSFQDEFLSYREITPDILERIDKSCVLHKCQNHKNRAFERGQLIYYSPFHQAAQEQQHSRVEIERKRAKASFDELIQSAQVELSGAQRELLHFMCKNDCKVSQTKMAAYCGIKKMDLNSTILETNSDFFKETGGELIVFNSAEECWELDDAVLALSSNGRINGFPQETDPDAQEEIQPIGDNHEGDNQERSILDLHLEMLGNTLGNANQSYKFYWAESLFHFMKQKRTSVSFHDMAACMVAHAWDDVLVNRFRYKDDDVIPEIVKNKFLTSHLSLHENGDSLHNGMKQLITNKDVRKLMKYVPEHFLSSYSSMNNTDNQSMRLYSIVKDSIILTPIKLDIHSIHELERLVQSLKEQYLFKVRNQ